MGLGMLAQRMTTVTSGFTAQCVQPLRALEQALAAQRTGFDQAVGALEQALSALESSLDNPPAQIAEDIGDIAGKADDHATKLAELLDDVDTAVSGSGTDAASYADAHCVALAHVDKALDQLMETSAGLATQATGQLAAWSADSDAGVALIDAAVTQCVQTVTDVNMAHAAECAQLEELCRTLEKQVAETLEMFATNWGDEITHLAAGTEQLLRDHLGGALNTDLGSAMAHLNGLRERAAGFSNALGEEALRLIGSMRQMVDLIAQIKPLIEMVRELA